MIIKVFIKKYLITCYRNIWQTSDKIDHNDLIYYFKNNSTTKNFNDFENGIEL